MAPSGAQQRQVHAVVQVAGECEGGGGEGWHGEWGSYRYCSQGRGQET